MNPLPVLFSAAVLLLATFFDLRLRIIPDELTIGGTLFVLLFWMTTHCYMSLLFALFSFAVFYLLYRLGVVAGGDAKLFTFLGAALPVLVPIAGVPVPFAIFVFLLALFLSFAYIFVVASYRLLKDRRMLHDVSKSLYLSIVKSTPVILAYPALGVFSILLAFLPLRVGLPIAVFAALWRPPSVMGVLYAYGIIVVTTFLLQLLFRRSYLFSRVVPVSDLKEGDVPGVFVLKGGKTVAPTPVTVALAAVGRIPYVAGPLRAGGLTREDIDRLRALGISELPVMETLPFTPFVLLGFVLAFLLLHGGAVPWIFLCS